jgi:hypothetical protein
VLQLSAHAECRYTECRGANNSNLSHQEQESQSKTEVIHSFQNLRQNFDRCCLAEWDSSKEKKKLKGRFWIWADGDGCHRRIFMVGHLTTKPRLENMARRHLDERHLAKRHLIKRYLADRKLDQWRLFYKPFGIKENCLIDIWPIDIW